MIKLPFSLFGKSPVESVSIPSKRNLKVKLAGQKRSLKKLRSFNAASTGRLFADWMNYETPINEDLFGRLETMRSRGRDMAKNNSYFRRWLWMRERNIVGENGISLQMKITNPNGSQDTFANNTIEGAFKDWGNKGSCSTDGKISWLQAQNEYARLLAVDGEVFVRLVRGFDNKYRFAIKFIDAASCDTQYNATLPNGNRVINGVEIDEWGRPVAYYFFTDRNIYTSRWSGNRIRWSAEDIVHCYKEEFCGQTRGFPRGVAAMPKMHMLDKYNQAQVVAARAGASKMGFYEIKDGHDYQPDAIEADEMVDEVAPGKIQLLPEGVSFKEYNPTFPANEHASFIKTILREAAGDWGVAYNLLANDLEGVNYSSLRAGALDERDGWKAEQAEMITDFIKPIFNAWLEMFLLTPLSGTLPMRKMDKFSSGQSWIPRSFPWVDPEKDAKAKVLEMQNLIESPIKVAKEKGHDYEELLAEIQYAKQLQEKYGLTVDNMEEKNEQVSENEENDDKDSSSI